jgi:hypothetical protein
LVTLEDVSVTETGVCPIDSMTAWIIDWESTGTRE